MEHNIIVNNSRQVSNVVTALQFFRIHWHTIEQLANLVGAFNPLPDFTDEDLVSLGEIQEQFSKIHIEEVEAENPKPEHRYAVYDNRNETIGEYDVLHDAWIDYQGCYESELESGCRADDGDFSLYDLWLDEEVTTSVPYMDVEYEWDAEISVNINGSRSDFTDIPSDVQEEIGSSISCGDTYNSFSWTVGDVEWYQIQDWEEEHKEQTSGDVCWDEAVKEVNDNAEKESTEA